MCHAEAVEQPVGVQPKPKHVTFSSVCCRQQEDSFGDSEGDQDDFRDAGMGPAGERLSPASLQTPQLHSHLC